MIRILLAIFLPWLMFFSIGRPITAIICLIMQLVFFGGALFTGGLSLTMAWIPSLWGLYGLMKYKSKDVG